MDSKITGTKEGDKAESQATGSEEEGIAANVKETLSGGERVE